MILRLILALHPPPEFTLAWMFCVFQEYSPRVWLSVPIRAWPHDSPRARLLFDKTSDCLPEKTGDCQVFVQKPLFEGHKFLVGKGHIHRCPFLFLYFHENDVDSKY